MCLKKYNIIRGCGKHAEFENIIKYYKSVRAEVKWATILNCICACFHNYFVLFALLAFNMICSKKWFQNSICDTNYRRETWKIWIGCVGVCIMPTPNHTCLGSPTYTQFPNTCAHTHPVWFRESQTEIFCRPLKTNTFNIFIYGMWLIYDRLKKKKSNYKVL